MAEKTFEKYLNNKHRAVYAIPLMTNLKPLDVLIKTDSQSLLPSRPVLQKVGSMINLGTRGEEYDSTLKRLREGLEVFERTGEEDEDLFGWNSMLPNIYVDIRSAASITKTLLGGLADANLYFNRSKTVNSCLRNVEVACVDKNVIMVDDPPQWKPDIAKRAPKWTQPGCNRNRRGLQELWIVYEIKSTDSAAVGAGLRANLGPNCILTGPGGSLRVTQTTAGILEGNAAEQGPKFMFAFRTMCFQFDAKGDVVDHEIDAGKATPFYCSGEDETVNEDARVQLGGLFLHPPTDDDNDAETELEWLEIQTSPEAGS